MFWENQSRGLPLHRFAVSKWFPGAPAGLYPKFSWRESTLRHLACYFWHLKASKRGAGPGSVRNGDGKAKQNAQRNYHLVTQAMFRSLSGKTKAIFLKFHNCNFKPFSDILEILVTIETKLMWVFRCCFTCAFKGTRAANGEHILLAFSTITHFC